MMSDNSEPMVTLLRGEQVSARRLITVSGNLAYILSFNKVSPRDNAGQKMLRDLRNLCESNRVPETLHPDVRDELAALELLNDDATAPLPDVRAIVLNTVIIDPKTDRIVLRRPYVESKQALIDSRLNETDPGLRSASREWAL